MCNCRLKYPRGLSIVTCILLYVSLIGLLVAYFQVHSAAQCVQSVNLIFNKLCIICLIILNIYHAFAKHMMPLKSGNNLLINNNLKSFKNVSIQIWWPDYFLI